MKFKALALAIAAALGVACPSCFTGIESTPRITGDDARRAGVVATAEQDFARQLASLPPSSWAPGKKWRVADDKISLIFSGTPQAGTGLAGSDITLVGRRDAPTVTGRDVVELIFNNYKGQPLAYRTDVPVDEWQSREAVAVPFAVDLDIVHRADSLMRGKTVYINTPLWYNSRRASAQGLRHIAVRVDSVVPGDENYPLLVAFTPTEFGDDAGQWYIFMTYGSAKSATRNFDRLFSFDNPRRRFPDIKDETWQLIIRSRVAPGMSRDEARLALGSPNGIDRGTSRGSMQMERWSYDNGAYLLFEDGMLVSYRL